MKPKLYLLNGPLGAGKTTILKYLIQQSGFYDVRIIENEFANISIDTEQLHGHASEVKTIAGLCVCCSTGDELVSALIELSGSEHPVIIEATGVANSLQLIEKLALSDVLEKYDIAQAIFVLDASEASDDQLNDYQDELRAADTVLVTKTDITPRDKVTLLMKQLRDIGAQNVHIADHGKSRTEDFTMESHIVSYFTDNEAPLMAHDSTVSHTVIDAGIQQLDHARLERTWRSIAKDLQIQRLKGDLKTLNGGIVHVEATPHQIRFSDSTCHTPQLVVIGKTARDITFDMIAEAMGRYDK